MKLTRSQMHERAGSLSGEIKAAREAQSECRRALEDQERLVTIAAQAVERADARVNELLTERAQLSTDMAEAILQVGEAPLAGEAAPAVAVEFAPQTNVLAEAFPESSAPAAAYVVCADHGRAISSDGEGGYVCDECSGAYELQMPNGIFQGADEHVTRAFDEATQP